MEVAIRLPIEGGLRPKRRSSVAGIGRIPWLRAIILYTLRCFVLNWIQFRQPHEVLTQLMCVQIGNPLFWIAYCVLRKGRRDGHDSVALLSGKVPVSNGIHLGSIFAAVEGVDGQERCTSVTREITRDCVRNFGRKTADAVAEAGGWYRWAACGWTGGRMYWLTFV